VTQTGTNSFQYPPDGARLDLLRMPSCSRELSKLNPLWSTVLRFLLTLISVPFSRVVVTIQKLNFKANWIIRGLLLVEMMRPKLPPLRTCPVVGSMRPLEATRAFRLLMGLAKLG